MRDNKTTKVGAVAYWPTLQGDGREEFRLVDDEFVNDTGSSWGQRVGKNMISPLATADIFHCPVCGQEYEVPSCIFWEDYHLAHLHDGYGSVNGVTQESVDAYHAAMRKGMEVAVEAHRVDTCFPG